jgi:DNA-binding NtrC family response regulator
MHNIATVRSRGRRQPVGDGVPVPLALAGESAAARRVRAALGQPLPGPLLLLAEDGLDPAGVARYVHERADGARPFVHIDCANPDPERLETAIFGGRTPAAGGDLETLGQGSALASARRGTVFLENIGELPAALQRRLARLLRDGEARIGGRNHVPISARLIASASPGLQADARDGRFRPDLLRRFGAMPIVLPPLRLRPEDLPAIAARIVSDVAGARKTPSFTPAALTVLAAMPWTGNVDELRTTLTRVLRGIQGSTVRQEDLLHLLPIAPFQGVVGRVNPAVSLREARRRFEREYIAAVLEHHDWRMSDAARTLGIERANLYRKTRQLGIARSAAGERPQP